MCSSPKPSPTRGCFEEPACSVPSAIANEVTGAEPGAPSLPSSRRPGGLPLPTSPLSTERCSALSTTVKKPQNRIRVQHLPDGAG